MSALTAPAREVLAAALGLATALRGSRVFHPRGQAYACRLVVRPTGRSRGSALLDTAGEHEGVLRLSRGVGLPRPLPDIDGLALRLPGLGVGGAPLDLLVNAAWRFAFAPTVLSPTWSSVLPHRTATGERVLLGARPRGGALPFGGAPPESFSMYVAAPLGAWSPWATLVLGGPVDGEQLRFEPTLGADDLVPTPLFRTLRAHSYDASQAARA